MLNSVQYITSSIFILYYAWQVFVDYTSCSMLDKNILIMYSIEYLDYVQQLQVMNPKIGDSLLEVDARKMIGKKTYAFKQEILSHRRHFELTP